MRRYSRPKSLCARCGNEARQDSPERNARRDRTKGRGLSIEIDGREGRRRRSSSRNNNEDQKGSPMHCYIVPLNNNQGPSKAASTTTYRETFKSYPPQFNKRLPRSNPASPVESPVWSPTSSSASSNHSPEISQPSQADTSNLLSKVPPRLHRMESNGRGRGHTTYRDHFIWQSTDT